MIVVEKTDSSKSEKRVHVLSGPSHSLIARAKHFIQAVDPPFSACLKCKETRSVLFVIDNKSVMTVVRDIVGPKFPRMKSLKSLKAKKSALVLLNLIKLVGINLNIPKEHVEQVCCFPCAKLCLHHHQWR